MYRRNRLTLGREDDLNRFIASSTPSTFTDVQQLREEFDLRLFKEQALESGFCPIRRQLYTDLFNELIRNVGVHCSERGELLQRMQNEFHQWMSTYEQLYSSAMAYGMRHSLNRMEEQKSLELIVEELQNECQHLCDELNQEKIRLDELERRLEQKKHLRDKELKALKVDVTNLRLMRERLRSELEATLNSMLSSNIFLGEPIKYDEEKK